MGSSHTKSWGCSQEDGHSRPAGLKAPSKGRRSGQDKSFIPQNPITAPILLPEIKSTKRLHIRVEKHREINGVYPLQLTLQLKR